MLKCNIIKREGIMQSDIIIRIEKTNNGSFEITRGNLGQGYRDESLESLVKMILKNLKIDQSTINSCLGSLTFLDELLNKRCHLIFNETKDAYDLSIVMTTKKGNKQLTNFNASKKFGGAIKVFTDAEEWSSDLVEFFESTRVILNR
jgi:hypothetical protein